jgi:hypothetical protein
MPRLSVLSVFWAQTEQMAHGTQKVEQIKNKLVFRTKDHLKDFPD